MKKVICFFVALFATSMLYSQDSATVDVIVTKDGQEIEAKIIAESSATIEYVEPNAQDGPLISISTDEILIIIYADGRIKYPGETIQENASPNYRDLVSRKGNKYTYKGIEMSSNDYANFLMQNDPEVFDIYKRAHSVSLWGWGIIGTGALFCCIVPCEGKREGLALGLAIGTFTMAAGGVTVFVGYKRMHRTVDSYNARVGKRSSISCSVITSQNGIGLALNF